VVYGVMRQKKLIWHQIICNEDKYHNKTLSENRAQAVLLALVAQGIAADRLASVGYGQDKPIAVNSTEEGKAKNRRVELIKR
jgi:OOP family OmpA-OmpF porin